MRLQRSCSSDLYFAAQWPPNSGVEMLKSNTPKRSWMCLLQVARSRFLTTGKNTAYKRLGTAHGHRYLAYRGLSTLRGYRYSVYKGVSTLQGHRYSAYTGFSTMHGHRSQAYTGFSTLRGYRYSAYTGLSALQGHRCQHTQGSVLCLVTSAQHIQVLSMVTSTH